MIQIDEEQAQALSWAEIEKLWKPGTGREDRQAIVRRLVTRAAHNGPQAADEAALPRPEDYDAALHRAVEGTRQTHERLSREKRDAERLWSLLEEQKPVRRGFLIRNDRRFQTWGLFECLRERARAQIDRELRAALEAAELAVTVAQSLPPAVYGTEQVHDFEGEALVTLAQVRRVAGDLEGAATALDQARAMLGMGAGDLLDKAELESARAALLRDLGLPEEAEQAGRKAVRLAHRVGGSKERTYHRDLDDTDPHLRGGRRVSIPGFRPRRH